MFARMRSCNPWVARSLMYGFAVLLFSAAGRCDEKRGNGAQPRAEHEVLTTAAWEALEARDYKGAIRQSELVVDKYAPVASRMQQQLMDAKDVPPVGTVTAEQEKAIHLRGPLNDVGAAHFICARAAYKLGLADKAKSSFQQAAKLDGARVWDPKGKFFWAVAPISQRSVNDPAASDKSEHELLTGDAWAAFNREDYQGAMKHADLCVSQFLSTAKQLQTDLTQRKETFPEGAVSDEEKTRVFQNGLLNDVCTCLFIKGQSAQKTGETKLATTAYQEAASLTHARCWDPQGWFWNPAAASQDRLEILK